MVLTLSFLCHYEYHYSVDIEKNSFFHHKLFCCVLVVVDDALLNQYSLRHKLRICQILLLVVLTKNVHRLVYNNYFHVNIELKS